MTFFFNSLGISLNLNIVRHFTAIEYSYLQYLIVLLIMSYFGFVVSKYNGQIDTTVFHAYKQFTVTAMIRNKGFLSIEKGFKFEMSIVKVIFGFWS